MSKPSPLVTAVVTTVPGGSPVWHTVRDAARAINVSESTIRRALARHGMRVGRTVGGYVEVRRAGAGFRGYVPVTATTQRNPGQRDSVTYA